MSSTSWTLEDLEALEDAIKKGVRRVKYQDREIEYRSLNEMLKLRDIMAKCLGKKAKVCRLTATTDKGIC